ncbi:PAS domain S-box-containing protein [Deinobacterium chartae]|uniref:histidine kinase n=1 Tax=Deinobacterium chartae TaxID=521158 RepID=A0A841I2Y5_9DEIO|nr:PAS domain-containing protein [Deinobacterium chartae]MBB6099384.1 PAS domain S-box-containing protein [Deinobacterium chartae]
MTPDPFDLHRRLWSGLSDALVELDAAGIIVDLSPAAECLLGGAADLRGQALEDIAAHLERRALCDAPRLVRLAVRGPGVELCRYWDALEELVQVSDAQGRLVYANPAWLRALGYGPQDLLHIGPGDVVPECDWSRAWQTLEVSGSAELRTELHGRAQRVPVRGQLARLESLPGYAVGVFHRYSETELALRRQQRLTEAILDSLPIHISLKDVDGRYQLFNKAAVQLAGLTREQVLGRSDLEAFGPDAHLHGGADDSAVRAGAGLHRHEERRWIDGEERVLLAGKLPLSGEYGEGLLLSYALDVTDLKRAEAELQRQKTFLDTVLDTSPSLIFVRDAQGRFLLVNRTAAQLFGCSKEQLIGQAGVPTQNPAELRSALEAERRVIEERVALRQEEPFTAAGGEVRWFETTKTPLVLPDGTVNVLVIAVDITERRRAEEQTRRQDRLLHGLAEIGGCLLTNQDLELSFRQTLAILAHAAESDRVALLEQDRTDERLLLPRLSYRRGARAQVTAGGEPLCMDDDLFERFLDNRPLLERPGMRRLFFPIHVEDHPWGMLTLESDVDRDWNQTELFLLQSAVSSLGGALARERSEAALRAAQAHLREAIESMSDGFAVYDAEDRLELYNERFRQDYGAAGETLRLGQTFETVLRNLTEAGVYGDLLPGEREAWLERQLERHRAPRGSTERKLRDGRWLLINEHRTPDGRTVSISADITELKRREQALSRSEARNRALISALPDTLLRLNAQGVFLDYHGTGPLARYSPESLIGHRLERLLPPELADRFQLLIERTLQDGTPQIFEYVMDVGSGQRDYEARMVPAGRGEVLALVRDISERRAVDRMKSEFVSTVSHELRTPLTSIRGSLGLLAAGVVGELTPQGRSLVEIAHANAERLVRLINDILDMDKIESGKMEFDMRPLKVRTLLERALKDNRAYAAEYGVELCLADLEDVSLSGDFDRLLQVLTNLISNAVKFSPAGEQVRVSARRQGRWLRVSVRDRGPGISEEFRNRIFQKFAQADTSNTRQKGGTGLGLSISRAIVERHGGRIDFETHTSGGSTFFFDLPLPDLHGARPRVLVCEDDPMLAEVLAAMLSANFETRCVHSAGEAKRAILEEDFAAMVLDLLLPDQDGLSLLADLKALGHTLPVVVVSAVASRARTSHAAAGVSVLEWLDKPVDRAILLRALRQAARPGQAEPRVLYIEDDPERQRTVRGALEGVAQVMCVPSLEQAANLMEQEFDLVLLDSGVPGAAHFVETLHRRRPDLPLALFPAVSDEAVDLPSARLEAHTDDADELRQTLLDLLRRATPPEGESP